MIETGEANRVLYLQYSKTALQFAVPPQITTFDKSYTQFERLYMMIVKQLIQVGLI